MAPWLTEPLWPHPVTRMMKANFAAAAFAHIFPKTWHDRRNSNNTASTLAGI